MAIVTTDGLGIHLRGRTGNVVYSQTVAGITMRDYVVPRDPKTPLQRERRNDFGRASSHWTRLTDTERTAWIAYAASLPAFSKPGSKSRKPTPHRVYLSLARKFLQVNEDGVSLLMPPTRLFFGDRVTVTSTGDPGHLLFTGDTPNTPEVVTEFWCQPLANKFRKPILSRYRSQGFRALAAGSLEVSVSLAPGCYAPAYRFVNVVTGQETPLILLPPVEVG